MRRTRSPDETRSLLDGAAPLLRDGVVDERRQGNAEIVLSRQRGTSIRVMSTPAQKMVAEQLLPNGVTDQRVIDVMSQVPREEFLSGRVRRHAYENRALAIDCGQTISQPLVVGLMTQAVAPHPEDRALEVGTGSGYQAAVLSRLVQHLISLELEPALAEHAAATLSRLGYANVEVAAADGTLGWPAGAPYDIILVAAASPA